jgi:hypothetical protein
LVDSASEAPEEDAPPTPKELKRSKKRAKKLLLHHLDPRQRKQLRRKGHFDVSGSRGNAYRISSSFPFNVRLAGDAKRSRIFFCTEAEDFAIPKWDVMLGQKLMIEADEGEFLKIANLQYIPRDMFEV